MKISDLCKLIEESFRSGKYPLSSETEKRLSSFVKIINKSHSEDLKGDNIIIETRIEEFFVLNNYIPSISHLPGIIEMDSLDSFKMLSRRVERSSANAEHISIKPK
ncbi:hypothetical protein [Candidatus Nitrosocosmicus hydrocola]|uniref:hypothetical protein n=1 Tax=Candidatus Nitrosocosmicus hydrocola TaxID=1826872 RepID=UPI0011E59A19|nr:hypothetical protein [Candidatus Nitrosocosmicus hydrocola]